VGSSVFWKIALLRYGGKVFSDTVFKPHIHPARRAIERKKPIDRRWKSQHPMASKVPARSTLLCRPPREAGEPSTPRPFHVIGERRRKQSISGACGGMHCFVASRYSQWGRLITSSAFSRGGAFSAEVCKATLHGPPKFRGRQGNAGCALHRDSCAVCTNRLRANEGIQGSGENIQTFPGKWLRL